MDHLMRNMRTKVQSYRKHITATLFASITGFVAVAPLNGIGVGLVGGLALTGLAILMAIKKTP